MAPRKTKEVTGGKKANMPKARKGKNKADKASTTWIPTFQRATLKNFEDEKTHEQMIDSLNEQIPGSRERWGNSMTGKISALKRKGRAPKVRNYFSGRGSLASMFGHGSNEDATLLVPNSPDRSRLLGVPIEVRENIYGFLLTQPKPIVVGPEWQTLQGKILRYNALQYVCKQIGDEATKFIYSHNVFVAMLRETTKSPVWERTRFIDPKFLSLFRNVVISCPAENWNMEWHEKAALTVDKLANANPVLKSLTIVVSPTRGVGTSTTAVGLEANPLRFGDFFYFPGPLMTSIRKLNLKFLNIVMKKSITAMIEGVPYTSEIKRLLISIDLTHFQGNAARNSQFSNEETIQIVLEKASAVETELNGLKTKFKAIFEDYEKALEQGFCRELAEDEAITDGTALATRR